MFIKTSALFRGASSCIGSECWDHVKEPSKNKPGLRLLIVSGLLLMIVMVVPDIARAATPDCHIDLESMVTIKAMPPRPRAQLASPAPDITGVTNFLEDRFKAMAVDLAEDRILNGMCSDNSNLLQYFPKTCSAYKVYYNLNTEVVGTGLSWLPATFRSDLKNAPSCLYLNRYQSGNDTGMEMFVLTKAMLDIHDGISKPLPELAGIQRATISVGGVKYSMHPTGDKNTGELPICNISNPSTCWLYYMSVMADTWQNGTEGESGVQLCQSFIKALNFDNTLPDGLGDQTCSDITYTEKFKKQIALFKKLKDSAANFEKAKADSEKQAIEKEILSEIIEYGAITSAIIKPGQQEAKKWLALWVDIWLADYNQASIDLLADLGCKVSPLENAGYATNASDASTCNAISLAGALSQAKTSDDVKALIAAEALPADAWRMRSHHTMWDFGAVVGARFERVQTTSGGISSTTYGVGLAAPIGIRWTTPTVYGSWGVMFSVIDVGGALSASSQDQQNTATVQPATSWNSLVAPGIVLLRQDKSLPITLMLGAQYSNAARIATFQNGIQQTLPGYRVFLGAGFDMPLLLLR